MQRSLRVRMISDTCVQTILRVDTPSVLYGFHACVASLSDRTVPSPVCGQSRPSDSVEGTPPPPEPPQPLFHIQDGSCQPPHFAPGNTASLSLLSSSCLSPLTLQRFPATPTPLSFWFGATSPFLRVRSVQPPPPPPSLTAVTDASSMKQRIVWVLLSTEKCHTKCKMLPTKVLMPTLTLSNRQAIASEVGGFWWGVAKSGPDQKATMQTAPDEPLGSADPNLAAQYGTVSESTGTETIRRSKWVTLIRWM